MGTSESWCISTYEPTHGGTGINQCWLK